MGIMTIQKDRKIKTTGTAHWGDSGKLSEKRSLIDSKQIQKKGYELTIALMKKSNFSNEVQ